MHGTVKSALHISFMSYLHLNCLLPQSTDQRLEALAGFKVLFMDLAKARSAVAEECNLKQNGGHALASAKHSEHG